MATLALTTSTLRFDDVESALAAAYSAGFGTDTVRVVPCRMVFAR